MPTSVTRRLAALVATATAVALVPLTVAPATASTGASAATAAAPATVSAVVGPVTTATPRKNLRWVKANRARATAKQSPSSKTLRHPDAGTRLVVLDRAPKRLKVRMPGGRKVWVSKAKVTTVPLRDATGKRYSTQRIRVSQQISVSSKGVGHVALGTKVKRLARTADRPTARVKVKLPNGQAGWVTAKRLTSRNVWGQLAQCESGGRPGISTGNGYYGMYQFTASTWRSVGGSGLPHRHSAKEQTKRAQILQARSGWGQWPHCTRQLGLR